MAKFRGIKTLQKFASVLVPIHNHFNQESHLNRRFKSVFPLQHRGRPYMTEPLGILRGLVERIEVHPIEGSFEIELLGEIARMVELPLDPNGTKKPPSMRERPVRLRWLRG